MKNKSLIIISAIAVFAAFSLMSSCKVERSDRAYLKDVLSNLEQIKSATYKSETEVYTPWDTLPSFIRQGFHKEYDNPSDSIIGSSFINFSPEDTTNMTWCYDGNMKAFVYKEQKVVLIDSFKYNQIHFRKVSPPFFNFTKNLIKYMTETNDSILIESTDLGDQIQFSFTIYDDVVEIIGRQIVHDTLYKPAKGELSKYDIWVNKSDKLPYRFQRDLSHQKTIKEIKNLQLNTLDISNFVATAYFPKGYIVKNVKERTKPKKSNLEGSMAPGWTLKDVDNKSIALKDLKSKVLVIQFTGIGCGACLQSIPFMKQLATDYQDKDFELVSIETWVDNINLIKNYQEKNGFNFTFLNSKKEVDKSYQVQAVPVFFILDENRIIRKIVNGYGKGTTDKEIREAINELL